MNKIFVGRLAWKTSRDVLANYFSKFGQVTDARVVADRTTGRSKGYGFVTFADRSAVDQAIKTTTHEIDGRAIVVNQANERPPQNFEFNGQQGEQQGGQRFGNNRNFNNEQNFGDNDGQNRQ